MATEKQNAAHYRNSIVTPYGRANWPKLAQPDTFQGNKSWSIDILVEKDDARKADMQAYNQEVLACAKAKWPGVKGVTTSRIRAAKDPTLVWAPIRDGDAEAKSQARKMDAKGEDPSNINFRTAAMWIVRCKCAFKDKKPNGGQPATFIGQEDLPAERIYGGCYCRACVDLATYTGKVPLVDDDGSDYEATYKGVRAQLKSVQFIKDGESFGGAATPASASDFGEMPADIGVGADVYAGPEASPVSEEQATDIAAESDDDPLFD